MIQTKVQAVVDAVCPNDGVSFGRLTDKVTWRINFKEEATVGQRAAAQAALDAFDLAAAQAAEGVDTQREIADIQDVGVCKMDPDVAAFLNMSPAQLDAWVDANITGAGFAAARTAFKVLGKLALMGARGRKLRNGA